MVVINLDKRFTLNRDYKIKKALYFDNAWSTEAIQVRKYLNEKYPSIHVEYYPKRSSFTSKQPWMVGFVDETNLSRLLLVM